MKKAEQAAWVVLIVALALQWYQGKGVIPVSKSSVDHVIVLDETSTPSVEYAQLFTDLRDQSKSASQFLSQGRKLDILDKDSQDENGAKKVPPADYEGLTLPAVLLYDQRKLVHRESLARSSTDEAVAEIVRSHSK